MPNQIEAKIKEERSHKLLEMSNRNEKEFLSSYIGEKIPVLFEQEENEYYKGHTSNYIVVKVKGKNLENKFEFVKVIESNGLELIGELLQ